MFRNITILSRLNAVLLSFLLIKEYCKKCITVFIDILNSTKVFNIKSKKKCFVSILSFVEKEKQPW